MSRRKDYFDYIEEHLLLLALRVEKKGKLNLLELHNHSENFYRDLCNLVYGWNLTNLNEEIINVEAIDLIDDSKKLVIQVSAKNTKEKIESSLSKDSLKDYPGYQYKYISIAKDISSQRKNTHKNPHNMVFDPKNDLLDVSSVLSKINSLDIDKLKAVYDLIKKELGREVDIVKLDTNLANIIEILSKEDWSLSEPPMTQDFEIEEKITYNKLRLAREIIKDYMVHHPRIDKKYSEFDSQGVNKSSSILNTIKKEYLKYKDTKTEDEIFFSIIEDLKQIIVESKNFKEIPVEELDMCVSMLVVDAFVRCKIFEIPEKI